MSYKVGIHPFGHDCAVACIDHKSKKIRAISLERLTRFKHDYRFIEPLLKSFFPIGKDTKILFASKEVSPSMVEYFNRRYYADVRFRAYKKILRSNTSNLVKFIKMGLRSPGKLMEMASYKRYLDAFKFEPDLDKFSRFISKKTGVPDSLIHYYDHHFSHACSAYYFAPRTFENNCLVVTLDGQGDGAFCKVFSIKNNFPVEEISSSNNSSIPLLYSLFTLMLGFYPSADEGKVEAWACYSKDNRDSELFQILKEAFVIMPSLEIRLNKTKSFPFESIPKQWDGIKKHFFSYKKSMEDKDFAGIIQLFFEEFFLDYIKLLKNKFQAKRMAFAGGAFANVKLNLRILEEAGLEEMFIFPAMGDDGAPLGCLAHSDYADGISISWLRGIEIPYFGPSYTNEEVFSVLQNNQQKVKFTYIGEDFYKILAEKIVKNKICGLFRGRMEFGPRALGHRSILASPFDQGIRDLINLKFKKREWFQPFCPSMLAEERGRILEKSYINKHMTCAFKVKEEFANILRAVVHIDGTARVQFVEKEDDLCYYNLLTELKRITSFGVVLNTSFNIHGKAMVMTPQDALDDFFSCGIDYLFIEGYLVERKITNKL